MSDPKPQRRTVVATMHGKERVIAPVLEAALGLVCVPAVGLDTDRFGTFTREIARPGSGTALEAARAKAAAALALDPRADLAVASEGSFGPHPALPLLALGRERVLLVDRRTGVEVVGRHDTVETNYAQRVVTDVAAAHAFAAEVGFPAHALIVSGARDGAPVPVEIGAPVKGLVTADALTAAVAEALAAHGAAFVETDMRAHLNPTRMRAIGRAAEDLVRRWASRCPVCDRPGFAVVETVPGLPCADCGTPTSAPVAAVWGCAGCGHREDRPAPGPAAADPGSCPVCNP